MSRSLPNTRQMARPATQSVMTPARLAEIGDALFGRQWQRPLARALGCSERKVRYLAAGEFPITSELALELALICHVRGEALLRLGRQLEKRSSHR